MSTRERWIVYPLLFMTLGIALRDKVIPPAHLGNLGMQFEAGAIMTPRIHCNELWVNGPNNRPVVVVGSDRNTNAGIVETFTAGGMPQVRLLSSDAGGMVTTVGRAGKLMLILGDTGQNFGVFAELPGLGQLIPLTVPWRFENRPSMPKPPRQPAAAVQAPVQRPPQAEPE